MTITTTQPQTTQARVLHVIQRAARTRTPAVTPREALAAYQREFGGRLTADDVKAHIQKLVDLGQLERTGHRVCDVAHQKAPLVRVPAALLASV